MNISGLTQSSSLYNLTSTTQTQSTSQTLADILKELSSQKDALSISNEAKALSQMPKPEKVDFAEMPDEDLVSFLQNMQEKTGFIPGIELGTDAADLTAEQLDSVRSLMTDMSARRGERPGGMGRMQGPPPPMTDVQNMTDEDLTALLQTIQEETGSIPGVDDADPSADVTALTAEQLQSVRDAFMSMMHTRAQEMMQNMTISRAVSAYEEAGTPSI